MGSTYSHLLTKQKIKWEKQGLVTLKGVSSTLIHCVNVSESNLSEQRYATTWGTVKFMLFFHLIIPFLTNGIVEKTFSLKMFLVVLFIISQQLGIPHF